MWVLLITAKFIKNNNFVHKMMYKEIRGKSRLGIVVITCAQ